MSAVPGFFPGSWGGGGVAPLTLATLAERDGWWAMYDPSNSAFRTFSGGQVFTTLADSLGNGPDLINATAENRPEIWADRFGTLDAMHAPALRTLSAAVSPAIAAPYFVAGTIYIPPGDFFVGYVFSMNTAAARASFRTAASNTFALRGGGSATDLLTGNNAAAADTSYVFGVLFNGANSEIWLNSALEASGTTTDGNLNEIALLARGVNDATQPWLGDLGAVGIYQGVPSSSTRDRMFAFLHEATGIEANP